MLNIWKKCAVLTGVFALMAAAAALAQTREAAVTLGNDAMDTAWAMVQERMSQSENTELGMFVLEQLAAGKSGDELAAAIKAKQTTLKESGNDADDVKRKASEAREAVKRSEEAKARAAEARQGTAEARAWAAEARANAAEARANAAEARANAAEASLRTMKDKDKRVKVAKKHGLDDNDVNGMGAFVNARLAEGLRGEELSAAIKEELNRRKAYRQEHRNNRSDDRNDRAEDKDDEADDRNDRAEEDRDDESEDRNDRAEDRNEKAKDKKDKAKDKDRGSANDMKDKARTRDNDNNKGKPGATDGRGNPSAVKGKPK